MKDRPIRLKRKIKAIVMNYRDLRTHMMGLLHVVDIRTMKKMLDRDDPRLTTPDMILIIESYTGVPAEMLTEKAPKPQTQTINH